MDIRILTLEEILYYGSLGELSIITESEWDMFQEKLAKYIDVKYKEGCEDGCLYNLNQHG